MEPTREEILGLYRSAILDGVARSLWVTAFVSARGGVRFDAPETPKAAVKAAEVLIKLYEMGQEQAHGQGDIVDLYGNAQSAWLASDQEVMEDEYAHGFPFWEDKGPSEDRRREREWKLEDAEWFGSVLAYVALGLDPKLAKEDHLEWEFQQLDVWLEAIKGGPTFTCTFDGEDLAWTGGLSDVREVSGKLGRITIVNPNDQSWTKHSYLFSFGGFSIATKMYFLVYANGESTALDDLIDYIAEHHENLLANGAVEEEYHRLRAEGQGVNEAQENSSVDTISGGNAGDFIHSEDLSINDMIEDPTEEQLQEVSGLKRNPPKRGRRGK